MKFVKYKMLFTLFFSVLTSSIIAQKKNISGIYFNTFKDDIGHNCCKLIEFLNLKKDKTFTYYQKDHQGDYFIEGYSKGKYKIIGDSILFIPTNQKQRNLNFFENFIDYSGFKFKILDSSLVTLEPVRIVAGGRSEIEKFYKADFRNFDSLKVSVYQIDSVSKEEYLVIKNDGIINYSFSINNRKTKKYINGNKTIKLSSKKYKNFLKKISEKLTIEVMSNNTGENNYDIYLYLKNRIYINGGGYFSQNLYYFLFKDLINTE